MIGEYKYEHSFEDCKCEVVEMSKSRTLAGWLFGKIPLVMADFDLESPKIKMKINVVERDLASKGSFVAISHAWEHGLGDPNNNAIHLCQLIAIQSVISRWCEQHKLEQRSLPWFIDTL